MAPIVPATKIQWSEPPMYLEGDRWHGPPGAIVNFNVDTNGLVFCCPACGQLGSPRAGAKWTITEGSFADVSTLTLAPSIAKSCCGWHGYLVKGQFQLNP